MSDPASSPDRASSPDPAGPRPDPQSLLASDADRERVAEVLRAAAGDGRLGLPELDERLGAVSASRTYGQLAQVTADLPDAGELQVPTGPRPGAVGSAGGRPAGVPAVVSGPARGAAVAVFSAASRKGRWVVPERFSAVAVMGRVALDLRDADFAAREVVISAFALFGGVEITVPAGVTVRTDGIGMFGGFDSNGAHEADPAAPVLTIRGSAMFGGIGVKREPGRRPRRRRGVRGGTGPDETPEAERRGTTDGPGPGA